MNNKFTKDFDLETFDNIDSIFKSKEFFQDLEYTINFIFKNIDKNTFESITSTDVLNSFKKLVFLNNDDIFSCFTIEVFLAKTDFIVCFNKIFWYKYWNDLPAIVLYIQSLLVNTRILNTLK